MQCSQWLPALCAGAMLRTQVVTMDSHSCSATASPSTCSCVLFSMAFSTLAYLWSLWKVYNGTFVVMDVLLHCPQVCKICCFIWLFGRGQFASRCERSCGRCSMEVYVGMLCGNGKHGFVYSVGTTLLSIAAMRTRQSMFCRCSAGLRWIASPSAL